MKKGDLIKKILAAKKILDEARVPTKDRIIYMTRNDARIIRAMKK